MRGSSGESFVSDKQTLWQVAVFGGPTIAKLEDRLWLAWNTWQNSQLELMSEDLGVQQLPENSRGAPMLGVFHDRLYLAWGEWSNAPRLKLNGSVTSRTGFDPTATVTFDEPIMYYPALLGTKRHLYLAWTGQDTGLNFMRSPDGGQMEWRMTLGDTSISGPAMLPASIVIPPEMGGWSTINICLIAWANTQRRLQLSYFTLEPVSPQQLADEFVRHKVSLTEKTTYDGPSLINRDPFGGNRTGEITLLYVQEGSRYIQEVDFSIDPYPFQTRLNIIRRETIAERSRGPVGVAHPISQVIAWNGPNGHPNIATLGQLPRI
jgi:hypothetical protein